MQTLKPALYGAGGALAFKVIYGYVSPYLPATLQTGGIMSVVLQAGVALGAGVIGMKVLGRQKGEALMLGALTVVLYSGIASLLSSSGVPGLSGLGFRDYTPYPMGAYIQGPTRTPGIQGLGYVSPAAVVGPTLSPRMSGLGAYMPMNVVPPMGDYGDGM